MQGPCEHSGTERRERGEAVVVVRGCWMAGGRAGGEDSEKKKKEPKKGSL